MSEALPGQKRQHGQVRELAIRLRQLALTYKPNERLPTRDELCQRLGTSVATLNEVLEKLEEQKVIYRQQGRGIFVSPQLFRRGIAIIFNAHWLSTPGTSPFWGNLLGMFAQQSSQRKARSAEDHFFYLLVAEDRESAKLPEECMQMIQEQRIHGVLSVSLPHRVFNWFNVQDIPHVSFAGPGPYQMVLDVSTLVRMGVESLVRQGCRRIALWGVTSQSFPARDAFVAALREHGLTIDPQLEYLLPEEYLTTFTHQEIGYSLVEQAYLALGTNRPDGVISISDQMTEGILNGLQHHGIVLGRDLFLVTHGNRGSMLFFDSVAGLTVIEFDPAAIVKAMFDLLDCLLAGDAPDQAIHMLAPCYRTDYAGTKKPFDPASR